MSIEKLYEELGRIDTDESEMESAQVINDRHKREAALLKLEQDREKERWAKAANRIHERRLILREAVRLAKAGMDPLQARIVAAERLAEDE